MRCGFRHEGCIVCDEALLACGEALDARCSPLVIPAIADCAGRDVCANIRAANDLKGTRQACRVIQRLCFSLLASRARASTRLRRAGDFSLLVQREVTKRNTPRHRTSRAARARCPALLGGGGPARTRASVRSDMRAFPPPSPAMLGAVKGEEDQKRKAKTKAESKASPSPAQRGKVPAGRKGALLIFGFPFAAARAGRKCLKGCAHDAREFVARTRTCVQRTPACPRELARLYRASAASGAAFLWSLSCRCRQESDPRAGRARKGEGTRQQKIRSNARSKWIPAYAGMTSKSEPFAARMFARAPARAVAG